MSVLRNQSAVTAIPSSSDVVLCQPVARFSLEESSTILGTSKDLDASQFTVGLTPTTRVMC